MLVSWIVGSNLIYISEYLYHRDGTAWLNENFKNYPDTYWNVIVFLTSGVEDYVPDSSYSKIITFLLLITGIIIVGFFTANLVPILIEAFNDKHFIKQKPLHLQFKNHYIICGDSRKLEGIIGQLSYSSIKQNRPILVISNGARKIPILCKKKYKNVWGVEGEATEQKILSQADVDRAESVIILADDMEENAPQAVNSKLITTALKLSEKHTIVELKDSSYLKHLKRAHASEIIDVNQYSTRLLSQSILTPGVSQVFYELLSVSLDSNEIYMLPMKDLAEIYDGNIIGNSYREVVNLHLESLAQDFIIIGYQVANSTENRINHDENSNGRYIINPSSNNCEYGKDYRLKRLDKMIIIAYDEPNVNEKHNKSLRTRESKMKGITMQDNFKTSLKNEQTLSNRERLNLGRAGFRDHIVICNWSKKTEQIIRELHSTNVKNPVPIIIITDQPQEVTQSTEDWMKEVFIVPGPPLDSKVLNKASLETASTAIILSDPRDKEYADSKAIVIALAIEAINRNVHTIVEILESENRKHFINTQVDEIICVKELTEKLLSQAALTHDISQLYLHLLTESEDTNEVYIIPVPATFIGKSWKDLQKILFKYDQEDIILIGFITEEEKKVNERTIHNHFGNIINVNKIYINPKKKTGPGEKGGDYIFQEGDKIVTICYCEPDLERFSPSETN
ncbi:MAG: hypothetical protein CMM60_04300 [Rhodospirillaceae bacterium]|nr:hypothetical protein [Rhodospirillaceae bacterium]|tara:strand:- start:1005 stop:3047 length:2043 start_codon:yes stop_codon:yes gene_type:complete